MSGVGVRHDSSRRGMGCAETNGGRTGSPSSSCILVRFREVSNTPGVRPIQDVERGFRVFGHESSTSLAFVNSITVGNPNLSPSSKAISGVCIVLGGRRLAAGGTLCWIARTIRSIGPGGWGSG